MQLTRAEREDLEVAFGEFRANRHFPRTPNRRTENEEELEELNHVKARAVLYSTEVFGPILSLIQGSVPRHELKRNDPLRQRLESLTREGSPEAAAEAKVYLEYVDALHELVRRVQERCLKPE